MHRLAPPAMLVAAGAAWGLTTPLMSIAVSTGFQPLGLIVWQNLIMAALLALLLRLMRLPLVPRAADLPLIAIVALFGTALPGYFSFLTAAMLPAGMRSVILSAVPMFVLPMAVAFGFERPEARRALGILLGALALALLARPGASASEAGTAAVLLALIAPLSYAVEATCLAMRGGAGLHPFQLLFGAALVCLAGALPLGWASGQLVSLGDAGGAAEQAVLVSGLLNAAAYSAYVWLVGQAGAVFASQIAYLVTGSGVLWSMLLLGERYGAALWAALALMLAGLALVQPRPRPVPPEPG